MTALVSDVMDASTGDLEFDASGQRIKRGSATVERVKRRLRTPRGQCPLDPTYGVDMSFVDKAYPDLAARWNAAVREALAPEIARGAIDELVVSSEAVGSTLVYEVSFLDVLERERRTLSLRTR